ncbi:MFS transporter [Geminicoccus harenae]|uniref:MFS transporter n=1 Tax=Geminicoccus harenae TaxID=2498453 RepID=UPI00168ACE02|nr:MFS transporter [Geminicoccus harenae]
MARAIGLPTPAVDRLAVAAIVGAGVVAAVQVGKAAIAAPLLQADLHVDLASIGWLTAVFALLGAAGGIPVGAVVRALGDRLVLSLGLLAILGGAAGGAGAASFPLLLGSRVVEGLGFLLIVVAAPAVLQRIAPPQARDGTLSLWSCFMPTGMALAMLVGPLFESWRAFWWATAVVAALVLVAVLRVVPAGDAQPAAPGAGLLQDVVHALKAPAPVLLALCFVLYSLMFFALFSFLPILLMDRMEMGHGMAGLLSALATAVNVLGNLAAGRLLARGMSRPGLIGAAALLMGLCALGIFPAVVGNGPALLLCLLFSAIGGLIPATLLASAPLAVPVPALTAIVVGLLMQGSNLGQMLGPVLVGEVIETWGWPAATVVVVAAAAMALGVAALLTGRLKAGPPGVST